MALYVKEIGGIMPQFVPMGGGAPAALSALKKEVDVGSCGVAESIDLVNGGELKALACFGKDDIVTEEGITIPSIANEYPGLEKYLPFGGWVGMAVAKGTPVEVVKEIQKAYDYAISQPKFKKYVKDNYFLEVGLSGKSAEEYAALSTSVNAWILYDLGFAPISPEKFNIPRP
jgi:tripartite-type tricarboxylate transporter receptor subunit TctC